MWIGAFSFAESLFVPIPLELVMLPYMMMRRDLVWRIALAALIGCLAGAVLGYGAGYFFFDTFGEWVVERFGWQEQSDQLKHDFQQDGAATVFFIGVSPVPFQLAMLIAGATSFSLALFVGVTAMARAIRYLGLALLVAVAGEHAERFWRNHSTVAGALILLIGTGALAWYYLSR